MTIDETDFDQLPEALRLALFEHARRYLSKTPEPDPLNLSQISEVTSIPITTVNRTYHIAMLKLKAAAHKREL